ncbi:MAG: biopolymer transporter ExbD [Deltaproteobacteria bacterium]|nr:biopolymer transporter ExbD [Deltaproteobacteria bacterium]
MAFGTSSRSRATSSKPQINVTPLIDVVLVVLIMLMMIAPSLSRKIDFELPKQVSILEPPTRASQILLTLGAHGELRLNNEPLDQGSLPARLHAIFESSGKMPVFFHIDDQIPYGNVVHLMDVCRGAGATTLGLADSPDFEPR